MDEEERKREMDDDVDATLASDGIDLFVDLWRGTVLSLGPKTI